MTVISGEKVCVRGINLDGNGICALDYQTGKDWYEDQPEQENYFLLLDSGEYETLSGIGAALLQNTQRQFSFTVSDGTEFQVLVFAENPL